MPARNNEFPWMSHYENYNFFEERMLSHRNVREIKNIGNGFYEITLNKEKTIRVFICECYSFGLAEYYETREKLGKIDAVIINSNWCGYTIEAKRYCREHSVGLYNIRGFMAALNLRNFWEYLTEDEKEYFEENGWI